MELENANGASSHCGCEKMNGTGHVENVTLSRIYGRLLKVKLSI